MLIWCSGCSVLGALDAGKTDLLAVVGFFRKPTGDPTNGRPVAAREEIQ